MYNTSNLEVVDFGTGKFEILLIPKCVSVTFFLRSHATQSIMEGMFLLKFSLLFILDKQGFVLLIPHHQLSNDIQMNTICWLRISIDMQFKNFFILYQIS